MQVWWRTTNDRASVSLLIAANLVPVVGAIAFGWDAGMIMLVYWAENLVIGFYNILKMAMAKASPLPEKLFLIPFFTVHFGLFCFVHGIFVSLFAGGLRMGGPEQWLKGLGSIFIAVLGLLVSHGYSFFENFVRRREYENLTTRAQMAAPCGRIVLLHIAIIAAGAPVMLLGSPLPLLIILVLLKIGIDLVLHKHAHGGKGGIRSILTKVAERRMREQLERLERKNKAD